MMRRIALGLLLLALAAPGRAEQVPTACSPRPMPAALDSVRPLPPARSSVAFSAVPAGQYPGRAWVVRARQSGPGSATLEIVRLLRRKDCNVYEIEARWDAPLAAADYRALARAAARLGTPPVGAFVRDDSALDGEEIVLDGTMVELRLKRGGWETRRELNHHGRDGAAVSALFRALVARHVPAAELPAEDWRTRGPG
jgi:hypothetical protein